MVDGSIRRERLRPLGLLWAAASGLAGGVGRAAQEQVARFFRSDGAEVPLPVLAVSGLDGPIFERGAPPLEP
jgi:hypothetical protein